MTVFQVRHRVQLVGPLEPADAPRAKRYYGGR